MKEAAQLLHRLERCVQTRSTCTGAVSQIATLRESLMTISSSDRLLTARRRFFDDGAAPRGLVPDTILRSWQRCAGMGLSASDKPHVAPITRQALREACQKYEDLRHLCLPELQGLYADARATGSIVILTAPDGLILEALGSADFLDKAARVALLPGVPWSENASGTNAIGTAMVEGRPVEVRGSEHFFSPHRVLSCSAVPIIDPFGKIAGVMDISGEASVHHVHALGMVRLAVDQIEYRLFERDFPGCRTLRIQRDASLLGTAQEGILVFDGDHLAAANRHGLALLGLVRGDIGRRKFEELFDAKVGEIESRTTLRDTHGKPLVIRFNAGLSTRTEPGGKSPVRSASDHRVVEPFFDTKLEHELERAQRVLVAGMPVLLHGETGTGKEVFARELHRRCAKPGAAFVAVNCAGLPESLIESELFGYEEGAFTGARRHGSKGLLRSADGGVLFLDEIGDMPLALQARLLRTLQEREVTPLGGSQPVKVNFALISATHRNLDDAVTQGIFRSDLYFRVAQYVVRLPSLVEHEDRRSLIKRIWSRCAAIDHVRMSESVLDALAAYHWPGNLRQLASTLRTLTALAGPGGQVAVLDLPAAVLAGGRVSATSSASDPCAAPTLAGITERALGAALEATGGNVSAAAKHLGISRSTLYRRLR
jgi:sigma-54 dependent transcriptional regulator, acetoin dehydrogenase operon transcriptional activator AcoR